MLIRKMSATMAELAWKSRILRSRMSPCTPITTIHVMRTILPSSGSNNQQQPQVTSNYIPSDCLDSKPINYRCYRTDLPTHWDLPRRPKFIHSWHKRNRCRLGRTKSHYWSTKLNAAMDSSAVRWNFPMCFILRKLHLELQISNHD